MYMYTCAYIHVHVSSVLVYVFMGMCMCVYTHASIFLLVSEVRSSPISSTLLKYCVTVVLSS
jgi:hypothetical protein